MMILINGQLHGLIPLIFLVLIFLLAFSKNAFFKTIFVAGIIAVIAVIMIRVDLINIEAVSERFFVGQAQDTSAITGGRLDIHKAALKAFMEKPILGYGSSPFSSRLVTHQFMGRPVSIHNIFLELLIRLGIVGLIAFLILIWQAVKGLVFFINAHKRSKPEPLFLLPILSLLVILFAGIGLSWQWRDIMWYLIGISLYSSFVVQKKHEKRGA